MSKPNHRLKTAIAATGLYQYEFANAVGVADWRITKAIRGIALLSEEDREKVASGLMRLIEDEGLRDTLAKQVFEES